MPRTARALTPLAVRNLKDPGLHFVGEVPGLGLQVLPSGGRSWVLRVKVGGKRRDMGLGGYPEVSLADARIMARDAREKVREGIDPIEARRASRSAAAAAQAKVTDFRTAVADYIADHGTAWKNPKHKAQWQSSLAVYAFPVVGDLFVSDIELSHVLAVLRPIWNDKTETASRVRGRMEMVLDWAAASGLREGLNPARWRGHLDKLLPAPARVKAERNRKLERDGHHAALPVAEIPAFMTRLRQSDGMGARALEFAILTAARSAEVRGATWAEFDLDASAWTIPAARMKGGREHRVPLTEAALAVLKSVPRVAGEPVVFFAPRGGQLSDMTLSAVMRRMKVPAVPHGFRSTFRDWVAECTAWPGDMAEMALAHAIGSKVEAAYRRGDMFERRRAMMQDWSTYLASANDEDA